MDKKIRRKRGGGGGGGDGSGSTRLMKESWFIGEGEGGYG